MSDVKGLKNKQGIINYSLILAAFMFLFNPNIAIIDPLPDFVGYILLCAALSRISYVHDRLGEAYSAFKRMIFIDGGKLLVMFWVFGMTVPNERSSSIMLWAFVFAVLEFVFLIPAYNKLFDGITQTGYLYANTSVFGENRRRSYTDGIRILTFAFISVKAVLSFLPELADLTNSTYDETMGGIINLYRFIGLLRGMAFIPVLILGIIWVVSIISYFKRIVRDSAYTTALCEKYEKDIKPKTGLFVRRGYVTFSILAVIALCLTADIRFDDVNILPDFLAAIFFTLAFVYLSKYNGQIKKSWLYSTVVYFCFSVGAAVCEYVFFDKYYYGAIIKSDAARNLYTVIVILNVIKCCCLVWVLLELYRALCKLIALHTGYVLGVEREERLVDGVHKDLKRNLIYALIATAVYVASDICFDIFAPKVGFMGLISTCVAVVCIGFYIKAFSEIYSAIDTKYMLE